MTGSRKGSKAPPKSAEKAKRKSTFPPVKGRRKLRPRKPKPRDPGLMIEERQRNAVALRRAGYGFQEIADTLDISLGQAFADVKAVRERLRADAEEDVEQIQATESARLELIVQKLTPLLNKPKQAIRAGEVLKAVSESRRKLYGADAPNRHEHSGPQGAPIPIATQALLGEKLNELASRLAGGAASAEPAGGAGEVPPKPE